MTIQLDQVSVFLSYAHTDVEWVKKLVIHLSLLQRQKVISAWYDREVVPGSNRAEVIDQRLEQASIILLLVSADFLASDACYGVEMMRALARHEAGAARVIPLIVRPTDWRTAPFKHLSLMQKLFQGLAVRLLPSSCLQLFRPYSIISLKFRCDCPEARKLFRFAL